MFATTKLRLRQSVGIVPTKDGIEFFNANTRSMLSLKMNPNGIIDLLKNFDGNTSFLEIASKHSKVSQDQLREFIDLLVANYIIINNDDEYTEDEKRLHRTINMLEDFFHSTSDVKNALHKINNSRVAIIGMGAVGSAISLLLAKDGVRNFILIDPDIVDISNIHRQYFFEDEVGTHKTKSIKNKIIAINSYSSINTLESSIMEETTKNWILSQKPDIVINCADEPSVDATSREISGICMTENIPHIIGGGYNLHLTLIGQTIVPFETACYECFNKKLSELNDIEYRNVRRLNISNRKLGSFAPLSGIAASLAALDAFKIIIGAYPRLQQINKRIEFNSKTWSFSSIDISKDAECPWCGENGKFKM